MKIAAPLPMDIRLMNAAASLLLVAGGLMCLAAGVWWLARLPVFALQAITVEGEVTRNNPLTLKTNVVPHLSGNFFTLDLAQAREAFEAVPWVRTAVVHREFPNRLRVRLLEQQPLALWGEEGGSTMLNQQGEVFDANVGEVEAESMPRLKGPDSQSHEVLAMYRTLRPVFQAVDMDMDELELTARGSWRVLTAQGTVIEPVVASRRSWSSVCKPSCARSGRSLRATAARSSRWRRPICGTRMDTPCVCRV